MGQPERSNPAEGNTDITLIYDGDCPFCSSYVRYYRLQKALGTLRLVNAREDSKEFEFVRSQGHNLNEGMVLIFGGRIFHGADCINRLALLSTPSGIFNTINRRIFASPRLSKIVYPWLRAGRNATLRLLGRQKI